MSLTIEQARHIANNYSLRRKMFDEEDEMTSLMVVLLNYGDHLTKVDCINGEWTGSKGDLPSGSGLPHCPNGHVLFESRKQVRLGLVNSDI